MTGKNVSPLGEEEDMPPTMLAGAADQLVFGATPAASNTAPCLRAFLDEVTHGYRLTPVGGNVQAPGENVASLGP